MKIIKWFKKILTRFSNLETIEEKSFWIVAPIATAVGFASFSVVGNYDFIWTSLVLLGLCVIIPLSLMVVVSKKKNYHFAYPALCVSLGAISAPITFIFNGGYLSGNMVFCAIAAGITALCYKPKYRMVSLILCFIGSLVCFIYVFFEGSPFPLTSVREFEDLVKVVSDENIKIAFKTAKEAIYIDQIFAYFICSLGLFVILNWVTSDITKYKINQDALQKYFDAEKRKEIFRNAMVSSEGSLSEHKKAVILFADISNFTALTEKMSSDLVASFLNDFFTTAGKYIHRTGGIIDKYIGDCVMAYWIDKDGENCVLNCVESMISFKQDIIQQSESIYKKYGIELNFSAGISYGDVIFGDIGSDTMHDYTIIGDAVNTASRIQGHATSGEMLISDVAAAKIKDVVNLERIEADHFFKGKNKAVDIYRVLGSAITKQDNNFDIKTEYNYELFVCGCRGSFPVSGMRFSEYGGETSCYLIRKDDYACIVDCGTGLKNAIELIKGCKTIDILLTHVHYDHILGFLMSKFPTDVKVKIYGRFDKWSETSSGLFGFMKHPYWPIGIANAEKNNIEIGKDLQLNDNMVATFYNSDHPDDACVIKVMCGENKVVFLADCEDANKIDPEVSNNADILFFDGMFDDEDKVNHKGWGHGTWQDGIRFIKGKNIKKLVVTHHSPEVGDHTLMLKETRARELQQNVSFAKSGDVFRF